LFEQIQVGNGDVEYRWAFRRGGLTLNCWIDNGGAVEMISKQGRYAETFTCKDIAFNFTS